MPTIRKTSFQISLAYQGGMPCSLFATDFCIAESPALAIELDLSRNMRVHDKSSNSYLDARDYAGRDHADLAAIQIYEAQVCEGLRKANARHPGARWKLVVRVLEKYFDYVVNIVEEPDSVALRVALGVVSA